MTAFHQSIPNSAATQRMIAPLREVIVRQWAVATSRGLLQLLAMGLALLLGVSLLLGFFYLPTGPRIMVAGLAWIAFLWMIARTLRPALRRWSLSRAAEQVERLVPQLNERLSSAVELTTQESNPRFRGSPELLDHLLRQAQDDAAAINPAAVVPIDSVMRWGLISLPVITAWLVIALNSHTSQAVFRGLFTTFLPWRAHLPAVLEEFQVQPGDVTLAQGDSLDITARISGTAATSSSATLVRRYPTGQILTQPMEAMDSHDFHASLDDLQQGFDYSIKTDIGGSEWFTAVVHPRPVIARLDVHYDYPDYTGLGSHDDVGSAGMLEAVVGTRVTLLIHTADAVVLERSLVVLDENTPRRQAVSLTQVAPADYKASFLVDHSGSYHIQFVNEYGLGPKEDPPRAIVARLDQAPTVAIRSPNAQVTVRPDDRVPVEYLAEDDFGVQTLDGIVQVDDLEPATLHLWIAPGDRRGFKGTWTLDVGSILAAARVKEASRIAYQLKVTDNRDPDPQTGLSARQVLAIDRNQWRSYVDQLNDQRKHALEDVIRRAIERLRDAENRNNRFVWFDENHFLSPQEQNDAHDLRELLATTSKELIAAAREYYNTPYEGVARQAQMIAETGIARSADDVARSEFAAADPPQRKYSANQAHQEIIDARQALEKLIESAQKAQQKFEAAEALEQAARKQDEAAREMALHPEKVDEARQTQQQAINKLNEAMQKNPALQDPKAHELAQAMAELTQRTEQEQDQQTKLQNATSKLSDAAQAQEAAKALAQQQKKLNEQIAGFARDQKDPLQQAGAETPHPDQQNQIVRQLEKGELQPANDGMKNAANQLREAARKFDEQARNSNPNLSRAQQEGKDEADRNNHESQGARDEANQAAENLNREANQPAPPPADSGAIQSARKAAKRIAKDADALSEQNKKATQDESLKKAFATAREQAAHAAEMAKRASEAKDARESKRSLDAAAREMKQAGQALAKAADAQDKAHRKAIATVNHQAAKSDSDRAKELAKVQDDLAARIGLQAKQLAEAHNGAMPAEQAAQQQRDLAHQTQELQNAARQLAERASDSKQRWLGQRAKAAQPAFDRAAQAQQRAADAQSKNDNQAAADAQTEAQQALSRANAALRGNPLPRDAVAKGENPRDGSGPDHPADGGDAQDGNHPEERGENGNTTPAQAMKEAAQDAQEAAAAQQQAMQPNPAAAQQASNALARATASQRHASAGDEGSAQASAEQDTGAQGAGDADISNAHQSAPRSGQNLNSSQGVRGQSTGGNNRPPAAVLDLGINAGQWARLPPLVRGELMTAAQQSSPPAYRQMIRDYYIRIAQMQDATTSRK